MNASRFKQLKLERALKEMEGKHTEEDIAARKNLSSRAVAIFQVKLKKNHRKNIQKEANKIFQIKV